MLLAIFALYCVSFWTGRVLRFLQSFLKLFPHISNLPVLFTISQIFFILAASSEAEDVASALSKLLKNVTFELPEIDIDQSSGIFTFQGDIKNMVCGELRLTYLDLDPRRETVTEGIVNLDTQGIHINCTADFSFLNPIWPHIGHLTGKLVAIAGNSKIKGSIDFENDQYGAPQKATMTKCDADFEFDKISIHGSVAANLLQPLIFLFKKTIGDQISKVACDPKTGQLPPLVDNNLTALLKNVSRLMEPYLKVPKHLEPHPAFVEGHWDAIQFSDLKALDALQEELNAKNEDGARWINELIYLASGEGEITEQLNLFINLGDDGLTDTNITLYNLTIKQFQTLSELDIAYRVLEFPHYRNNFSLGIKVQLDELILDAEGRIDLGPGKMVKHGAGIRRFDASMNLTLKDIYLNLVIEFPVNHTDLTDLTLGQLRDNLLSCMASFAEDFNITLFDMSVGSFEGPTIYGFAGVAPLFNDIIDVGKVLFQQTALEALHGGMELTVRGLLNKAIKPMIEAAECPSYIPSPNDTSLVNFEESPLFNVLSLVESLLTVEDNPFLFSLNDAIDVLLPNGTIQKQGTFGKIDMTSSSIGHIDVEFSNLTFYGLDQFSRFFLMKVEGPQTLSNYIEFAEIGAKVDVKLDLEGSAFNGGDGVYDVIQLTLDMKDFYLAFAFDLLMRNQTVNMYSFSEFEHCPLQMFESMTMHYMNNTASNVSVDIHCWDCHSSGWEELSRILEKPESQKQLNKIVTQIFNTLSGPNAPLAEGLNNYFSEHISGPCGGAKTESSEDHSALYVEICLGIVVVISIAAMIRGIIKCNRKRGKEKKFDRMRRESYEIVPVDSYSLNSAPVGQSSWLDETLFMADCVPGVVKFVVPVSCLAAIGIFLTAHLSYGARVELTGTIGGDNYELPSLFEFSLANSIRDMWSAKVYPLALLIAGFSGGWPYLKLFLMLCAWMCPMTRKCRLSLLQWVDALGKWSLIDAYVLVLMMVAFTFSINSPNLDWLPPDFLELRVLVRPGWGIFGFIIAAVISLIVTHIIIFYHRKEEEIHLGKEPTQNTGVKRSAAGHNFMCFSGWEERQNVRLTMFAKVVVFCFLIFSAILLCAGAFIDSFVFNFGGLAGAVLDDKKYSLFSVANQMLPPHPMAGEYLLYFTFILFAFFVPLANVLCLAVLWVVPMTSGMQKAWFVTSEILFAWSSLEVFIVGVLAAMTELPQFVDFTFGSHCDAINNFMTLIAPGPLDDCIVITTQLVDGCWVLWAAALVWVLAVQTVTRLAERAVKDRRGLSILERYSQADPDESPLASDKCGFELLNRVGFVKLCTSSAYRSFSSPQNDSLNDSGGRNVRV